MSFDDPATWVVGSMVGLSEELKVNSCTVPALILFFLIIKCPFFFSI